jgi:histidinol dehydrogenase
MTTLRVLTAAEWLASTQLSHRRFTIPAADEQTAQRLRQVFGRDVTAADAVRDIVADVRERGDAAVRDWTKRLEGVDQPVARMTAEWMASCWDGLDAAVRDALTTAAGRIGDFHRQQVDTAPRGRDRLCLRPEPLRRVGCYVPGGRGAYPSTVLMSVIPAQVADVQSIAVCSPAAANGLAHPVVAAAAHLLGVGELYAVGGAQAVAAMAFGTDTIAAVDKVVGPGNIFVTLAKREVFGAVDIDQLAGPSEILVIASAGAVAEEVAADLVSQLEHDPMAWAVCLTDSTALAQAVVESFALQSTSAARAGIIAASAGRHGAVVLVENLDEALSVAADFAPEHLSLQGPAAEALRDRVRAAGAIFCGRFAPVSIGDYIAGPNHTLPTQGSARYRGPLSVMDFVRWPSVVDLDVEEFRSIADAACRLAVAEGLLGHEHAIRLRLEETSQ